MQGKCSRRSGIAPQARIQEFGWQGISICRDVDRPTRISHYAMVVGEG